MVNAAKLFRISNNDYTGITVTNMSDNGFDIEPFTDGVAENAYGDNVTVVAAGGGANATLTYVTDSNSACASLAARYGASADGVTGANCNGGATLTLTIN